MNYERHLFYRQRPGTQVETNTTDGSGTGQANITSSTAGGAA